VASVTHSAHFPGCFDSLISSIWIEDPRQIIEASILHAECPSYHLTNSVKAVSVNSKELIPPKEFFHPLTSLILDSATDSWGTDNDLFLQQLFNASVKEIT